MRHQVRRAKKKVPRRIFLLQRPSKPSAPESLPGRRCPSLCSPSRRRAKREGRPLQGMQKKEEEQDFSLVRDFFPLPLKGRRMEEGTDFPGEGGAAAAADGRKRKGREREVGKVFPFRPSSRAKKGQRVAQRCKTKMFLKISLQASLPQDKTIKKYKTCCKQTWSW